MNVDTLFYGIGALGFPIMACVWLATHFRKSLDENTKALNALKDCVEKLK